MAEGKLTLPAIFSLNHSNDAEIHACAQRIKSGEATPAEIARLVDYTKAHGGIEYAEQRMLELRDEALSLLPHWQSPAVREALEGYIHFVVERKW